MDSSICLGDSVWIATNYYTQTGYYIDTLENSLGCDSIITLNLSVLFQGDSIQNFSICEGDSIVVFDSVYDQTGNYIDSVYNEIGCLTVFYTSVAVNENPIVFLGNDTTICADDLLVLDAGPGFESYLWNTNENSQSIVVGEEGLYSVEVVNSNACIGGDSIEVNVDVCSSIDELESDHGIRVYPNPSSGSFTISSENNVDVSIYRSDGVLVFQKNNLEGNEQITLQESGVYLIRFIIGNEIILKYSLIVNK